MTPAFWCGVLVSAAALLTCSPAPRPRTGRPPKRRRPGRKAGLRASRGRNSSSGALDVGALMTEVAARLRMGASVPDAWSLTLRRAGLADGVARSGPLGGSGDLGDAVGAALLAATAPGWSRVRPRARSGGRATDGLRAEIAAVTAAVRLAERLGSPLADVLDRCAAGVVAAGRAESARRVALAGPASTARLLGGLPPVGLLLGVVLGADPVAALTDGGLGTAAGAAGLALLLLGRRWSSLLFARAKAAGAAGALR